MPIYESREEAHKRLAKDKEEILNCLARWVLNRYGYKKERRACLERMYRKRLGPDGVYKDQAEAFINDLRERIIREWKKKQQYRPS